MPASAQNAHFAALVAEQPFERPENEPRDERFRRLYHEGERGIKSIAEHEISERAAQPADERARNRSESRRGDKDDRVAEVVIPASRQGDRRKREHCGQCGHKRDQRNLFCRKTHKNLRFPWKSGEKTVLRKTRRKKCDGQVKTKHQRTRRALSKFFPILTLQAVTGSHRIGY